ncbi:MAG: OstA family protein [Calothrix sp. C42_A2020_038]|nr:OstA family protein [Calothrix sp. C42_A2020_038]
MLNTYKLLTKSQIRRFSLALVFPVTLLAALSINNPSQPNTSLIPMQSANAQNAAPNRALQIKSDIQEYDANSQVVTARGNVQMFYSARGIQATAAQAQYFSRERQIILSGNVYILQQGGNSIRGERVVYLIDQGRFVAQPQAGRQVESIYIVNETQSPVGPAPRTPALRR